MLENSTYKPLGESLKATYERWLTQSTSNGMDSLMGLSDVLQAVDARIAQNSEAPTTILEVSLAEFFSSGFLSDNIAAIREASDELPDFDENTHQRPNTPVLQQEEISGYDWNRLPRNSGSGAELLPPPPADTRLTQNNLLEQSFATTQAEAILKTGQTTSPVQNSSAPQQSPASPLVTGPTQTIPPPSPNALSATQPRELVFENYLSDDSPADFRRIGSVTDWAKGPRMLEWAAQRNNIAEPPDPGSSLPSSRAAIILPQQNSAPTETMLLLNQQPTVANSGNVPPPPPPAAAQDKDTTNFSPLLKDPPATDKIGQHTESPEAPTSISEFPYAPTTHVLLPDAQQNHIARPLSDTLSYHQPETLQPETLQPVETIPQNIVELLTKQLTEAYQRYYGHAH